MDTNVAEYDIIIVGGGTAGLLLADELSRDTSLRIHVVEAGKDCGDHSDTQRLISYTANLGSERDWQFESVPQPNVANRTFTQNAGKLLGGSSSINGGYYVAPSRAGVAAWSKLGLSTWSPEDFQEACLETIQITPPKQRVAQDMGIEAFVGQKTGAGPVHVAADLEEHPVTSAYFQALRDLGYPTTSSVFSEYSAIGQGIYFTHDPASQIRSDASSAFAGRMKGRSNVTLSLDTTVKRVIVSGVAPHVVAKGIEIVSSGGETRNVFASREVILAAGAFGTPKVLELSGIGQAALLQKYQIPVVIENAYVGERLTNHIMGAVHCELAGKVPDITPGLKAMAYLASKDAPGLVEVLGAHTSKPGDDQTYDEAVKQIFLDQTEGSCYHFMGWLGIPNAWSFGVISAIPFSQGSTHITSSDVNDKPTVDPNFFSHPLDMEVVSRHLKTAAGFVSQPAMKGLFKEDIANLAKADLEQVKDYLRQGAMTAYHSVGTASMRPRNDGGVVDEQLKVYGTSNLRVVDASVIPMIAHGNPMAAVYGVAKRAADMIKKTMVVV